MNIKIKYPSVVGNIIAVKSPTFPAGSNFQATALGSLRIRIFQSQHLLNPNIDVSERSLTAWPLGGQPSGAPTYDEARGVAYVSLADRGSVVALNLADRKREPVMWRFPSDGRLGQIVGQPALGNNGVYVADDNAILYAIGFDGKKRWQVDLGSSASTGVFAHQGRLFIGTRGKDLLCFEEGDE